MNITNKNIDGGKEFDWGKTSTDYAPIFSYAEAEWQYSRVVHGVVAF